MQPKTFFLLLLIFCLTSFSAHPQTASNCGDSKAAQVFKPQSIGIVISSNDPETVWNAFRLANHSAEQGDTVSVFLLGKGVESPNLVSKDFDVKQMMETFSNSSGELFACGTCLQIRKTEGSKLCPVSTLSDLYAIIKTNKIILTF
jgi:sulfur relay (sulfurtransferase) complex TusBCD TusD component (DsrE family)